MGFVVSAYQLMLCLHLQKMQSEFKQDDILGEGGFCRVYKCSLVSVPDATEKSVHSELKRWQ